MNMNRTTLVAAITSQSRVGQVKDPVRYKNASALIFVATLNGHLRHRHIMPTRDLENTFPQSGRIDDRGASVKAGDRQIFVEFESVDRDRKGSCPNGTKIDGIASARIADRFAQ